MKVKVEIVVEIEVEVDRGMSWTAENATAHVTSNNRTSHSVYMS